MSRQRKPGGAYECPSGKASYSTQGRALRAIDIIRRDNAQAAAPLPFEPKKPYRCRHCKQWHLTSKED